LVRTQDPEQRRDGDDNDTTRYLIAPIVWFPICSISAWSLCRALTVPNIICIANILFEFLLTSPREVNLMERHRMPSLLFGGIRAETIGMSLERPLGSRR
jgi:hypothetical protein